MAALMAPIGRWTADKKEPRYGFYLIPSSLDFIARGRSFLDRFGSPKRRHKSSLERGPRRRSSVGFGWQPNDTRVALTFSFASCHIATQKGIVVLLLLHGRRPLDSLDSLMRPVTLSPSLPLLPPRPSLIRFIGETKNRGRESTDRILEEEGTTFWKTHTRRSTFETHHPSSSRRRSLPSFEDISR